MKKILLVVLIGCCSFVGHSQLIRIKEVADPGKTAFKYFEIIIVNDSNGFICLPISISMANSFGLDSFRLAPQQSLENNSVYYSIKFTEQDVVNLPNNVGSFPEIIGPKTSVSLFVKFEKLMDLTGSWIEFEILTDQNVDYCSLPAKYEKNWGSWFKGLTFKTKKIYFTKMQ